MGLQRVRYFTGQLLTAEDFQAEQDYLLQKQRRHNRMLHGAGIVDGLSVSADGSSAITISPGMALDCQGNEIVAGSPVQLALQGGSQWYITARYVERLSDPVPISGNSTDLSAASVEYRRVEEGSEIELTGDDPWGGHASGNSGGQACGKAHAVTLARVLWDGGRWFIDDDYYPAHIMHRA